VAGRSGARPRVLNEGWAISETRVSGPELVRIEAGLPCLISYAKVTGRGALL